MVCQCSNILILVFNVQRYFYGFIVIQHRINTKNLLSFNKRFYKIKSVYFYLVEVVGFENLPLELYGYIFL